MECREACSSCGRVLVPSMFSSGICEGCLLENKKRELERMRSKRAREFGE